MAPVKPTSLADVLHPLLPMEALLDKARELGVLKRQRKADVAALLTVVLLTLPVRNVVSRAQMFRGYLRHTGKKLSRSAFYKRFTPPLEALLRFLLASLQDKARADRPHYTGVLKGFRDVVVADATVIAVHPALRWLWPGSNDGTAAIKLHTWVRAVTGELLWHKLTQATAYDGHHFGVNWSHTGVLFLLDRAYNSASLWWRIHRVGGFFVTRLPSSYKPTILGQNRKHRGASRKVKHRKLREALVGLERQVLDVTCGFRVRVRPYRSARGRRFVHPFRVVALKNKKTGRYHLYVTNLPPERLAAENIGLLYRLRWEVELSYKAGKSGCGLAELNSNKPHVVRILVLAALVRQSLAMRSRLAAMSTLSQKRWVGPLMWVRVFNAELVDVVRELVGVGRAAGASLRQLARLAVCPDRARAPLRHTLLRRMPLEARV